MKNNLLANLKNGLKHTVVGGLLALIVGCSTTQSTENKINYVPLQEDNSGLSTDYSASECANNWGITIEGKMVTGCPEDHLLNLLTEKKPAPYQLPMVCGGKSNQTFFGPVVEIGTPVEDYLKGTE